MTKCRQRPEISNMEIPVISNYGMDTLQLNEWYPCKQPEELENDEYNVRIAYKDGQTIYASSIDLEFK